ncbi:MAG: N-acetylmuramoyl-L-alanine amidase, partial [Acidobacteria bacterium]|nr:N-acetylmuramoyl-L-alanine amidase [Acidobacteriota bacterium]
AAQRSRPTQAPRARTAQTAYDQTLVRERALRASRRKAPPLSQLRAVIADYDALARKWPRSGYADNALWNGANLAYDANIRFGARQDRDAAIRMLQWLVREYPSSSLARDAQTRLRKISASSSRTTKTDAAPRSVKTSPPAPSPAATELAKANIRTAEAEPSAGAAAASPSAGARVVVRDVKRVVLPEVVRVTIELDGEVAYHEEALHNPERLFFDLRGTQFAPAIEDGVRAFDDGDVVKEIRLGTHPGGVTRVVVDTNGVARHSLFTLYNPYRLVLDLYRQPALTRAMPPAVTPVPSSSARAAVADGGAAAAAATVPAPVIPPAPLPGGTRGSASPPRASETMIPTTPAGPTATTLPSTPESNSSGNYSLARQLGLSVSRVVIDAGHGGHDPGSLGDGIREAELVLDVALRLEKLLKQEGGIDVVMTRRTDAFIELEERTRIANRHNADLFLSIHANSSRKRTAQGIETFVLNFANNSDAEEVAARENAIARGSMRQLPDIVKAITLNNKLDESRDLAEMVQANLVSRLRQTEKELPDRGIKQAPLVVLIGASMPSVLAEIGFVSTPEEGSRLKTSKYRQEIAEALRDAVLRYQKSLKGVTTTAQVRP